MVERDQAVAAIAGQAQRARLFHPPAIGGGGFAGVAAADQLQRHVKVAAILPGIEDGDDVGMVDLRRDARFAQEALAERLVAGVRRADDFERHLAPERGLHRLEYRPHAALTDLSQDLVAAERGRLLDQPRRHVAGDQGRDEVLGEVALADQQRRHRLLDAGLGLQLLGDRRGDQPAFDRRLQHQPICFADRLGHGSNHGVQMVRGNRGGRLARWCEPRGDHGRRTRADALSQRPCVIACHALTGSKLE